MTQPPPTTSTHLLQSAAGVVYRGCAWVENDPKGPWCPYEKGSCKEPGKAAGEDWDYCVVQTTLAGCQCMCEWALLALTFMFWWCAF